MKTLDATEVTAPFGSELTTVGRRALATAVRSGRESRKFITNPWA